MSEEYAFNDSLYQQISFSNLIPKMEAGGLLGPGRWVEVDDKKLHKFPAIDIDPGWIYVNPNPDLFCMEYQAIVKGFGFIPKTCRNCYKVVVMPRSFHELMQLYELEVKMAEENPRCWCKCGIEQRQFVPRNYGGYFYTQGLEVGKSRWQTVKDAVSSAISPDVNVILKRYCTEFELRFGPSDKYQPPPYADSLEDELWANIDKVVGAQKQPKFIRDHAVHNWMDFAWGRGDMTVKLYNNNKPLVPPYVTYHGKGE